MVLTQKVNWKKWQAMNKLTEPLPSKTNYGNWLVSHSSKHFIKAATVPYNIILMGHQDTPMLFSHT